MYEIAVLKELAGWDRKENQLPMDNKKGQLLHNWAIMNLKNKGREEARKKNLAAAGRHRQELFFCPFFSNIPPHLPHFIDTLIETTHLQIISPS